MANPYYVAPLGGLDAYRSIGVGIRDYREGQQQDREKEQKQALISQAQDIFDRGDPQEIARFSFQNPEIGKQIQGSVKFKNEATRQNMLQGMQQIIAGGPNAPVEQILNSRAQFVESQGGDATQTRQEVERYRSDPEGYTRQVENSYALMDPDGYTAFKKATGDSGGPNIGKTQPGDFTPDSLQSYSQSGNFNDLVRYESKRVVMVGGVPHMMDPVGGTITPGQITEAGFQPTGSPIPTGQQGTPVTAANVAANEAEIARQTEEAKLSAQLDIKPKIERAVSEARTAAAARGESLTSYQRAKASLPGIKEVVNKLVTLSDVASYTLAGRGFDEVVKQLGFGSTEGSTARAKMQSLVNNQILPLLRDTFGAQFTEREGDSLRKTMLDIDAPPEQKRAILDSFIEQKMRDLETKKSTVEEQAGVEQKPQRIRLDADGNIIQ